MSALVSAATFMGETPQGLVEIKDYRNSVYLFIPAGHDKSLSNSMLFVIPDSKETSDELVKEWVGVAKKKNLIVVVPVLQMKRGEIPLHTDEYLMKIKKDLTIRYHVAKTYVTGKGEGAEYAAYLGVQYPEEFAGAGLINGSWVNPYEKLMDLSSRPMKQIPFFVSLYAPNAELMKETEARAYEFTNRGYLVYLEKFDQNEKVNSLDLKMRMMDWLLQKSESWERVVAQSKKTKKEKISNWLAEFFFSPVHH